MKAKKNVMYICSSFSPKLKSFFFQSKTWNNVEKNILTNPFSLANWNIVENSCFNVKKKNYCYKLLPNINFTRESPKYFYTSSYNFNQSTEAQLFCTKCTLEKLSFNKNNSFFLIIQKVIFLNVFTLFPSFFFEKQNYDFQLYFVCTSLWITDATDSNGWELKSCQHTLD